LGIGIWLERFALLDLLISVCFLIERDKLSIGLNARLWEREYLILAQAGGNMEVFSKRFEQWWERGVGNRPHPWGLECAGFDSHYCSTIK